MRRDPVFSPTSTRSPVLSVLLLVAVAGNHTVGEDGLDLGLVALFQLDNRSSSEGGEHTIVFVLVSSSEQYSVAMRRCCAQ